ALRPEVLALVVEAACLTVDDHPQRNAVDAGADAAVVERRARVDGHHVTLRWIADGVGTGIDHVLEQYALVETGAADQEVVGRPFAAFVLSPSLAQPITVGFESASGEHAATGSE